MPGFLDSIHGGYVHNRRVRVLCAELVRLLPTDATILDVGCGDGMLDALMQEQRPDVCIEGIDVLVREDTQIPVQHFDGRHIPFPADSFDVVQFVDVLHHTEDPEVLLREAARVARRYVLLKDHTRNGILARQTLRLMDWVGNARHGVVLPYNYLSRAEWYALMERIGLVPETWKREIPLYPIPVSLIAGRSLQFIARLEKVTSPIPHLHDASDRDAKP
jgi:SAM-dependent methyltransferase